MAKQVLRWEGCQGIHTHYFSLTRLILFVSNFFFSSNLSISTASEWTKSNSSHLRERSDLLNKHINFIFSQENIPFESIMSWQRSQLCCFCFIAKTCYVYGFHGIALDSCGCWPASGPFSTTDTKLAAYFCPFQSPDHI